MIKINHPFTFTGRENCIEAKVCNLYYHTVVNHAVSRFKTPVDCNVACMEIRHTLQEGKEFMRETKLVQYKYITINIAYLKQSIQAQLYAKHICKYILNVME